MVMSVTKSKVLVCTLVLYDLCQEIFEDFTQNYILWISTYIDFEARSTHDTVFFLSSLSLIWIITVRQLRVLGTPSNCAILGCPKWYLSLYSCTLLSISIVLSEKCKYVQRPKSFVCLLKQFTTKGHFYNHSNFTLELSVLKYFGIICYYFFCSQLPLF